MGGDIEIVRFPFDDGAVEGMDSSACNFVDERRGASRTCVFFVEHDVRQPRHRFNGTEHQQSRQQSKCQFLNLPPPVAASLLQADLTLPRPAQRWSRFLALGNGWGVGGSPEGKTLRER